MKRVLKAINPFDQKIRDFLNSKVDTSLSMVQQAGAPYQGDIPLNLEALGENGLIAIYETLLNQAKKLSVDADYLATESLALSLQMAAGRIAELYAVLGNEAYADALNPTVDLGADALVDDTAEGSVFPFMNQCESLLDEELCLLRGRDLSRRYADSWTANVETWEYPHYNRLAWNFTADVMGGQVAYVENYGIRDVCGASDASDPTAKDGVIDVYDAKALYPQGHGDAWGHYLSAEKGYYALLRHPNFGWKPQIEGILAGQTEITIGYLHEKRFAQVAEMKAKTGERVVAATQRANYVAGAFDTWLSAEDDDGTRAWGTDEWATRAHLGAYYDWATVNALLPARSAEEGLVRMLDRESTKELGAIAASARRIQSSADAADAGLNPLGLSDRAIPFDISPTEIDAGKTHFEQVLDRAKRATKVAREVFLRAKAAANALRDQNASADYERLVSDEEAAIERRLIEIYGYPYDDDIGPGKTYPQGYAGPDIYHYEYVETYDLDGSGGVNGAYRGVAAGDGSYGRYIDVTVDDYRLVTTNVTGTFQSEIDTSLADNGFFGNIIVGAVSWYQDKLAAASGYIDPWSKYTGLASADFQLPVAVVDTAGDALDGKVDYTFAVAAWSNAPWVASYYVGENGFTPKPREFHGQRKAEGETQLALNGYAKLLAEIDVKANALFAANAKLQGLIDELTTLDYTTQMGYVTDAAQKEVENYTAACKKNAETVEKTLTALKELKDTLTESGVEAFPKLTGLSFDLTSAGRAALLAVKSGVNDLLNGQINAQSFKVQKCEEAIEELEDTLSKQFSAWMSNADRQKKIAAIKEQTAKVKGALAELEIAFTDANERRMNFAKVVAEGDALQAERLRIQWAADLSQSRYRNMTYQIFRNDALQRYHEAFELAAKYAFLAAKAYDYETGLLQSDRANTAGSAFMTSIVKARALGRFTGDGAARRRRRGRPGPGRHPRADGAELVRPQDAPRLQQRAGRPRLVLAQGRPLRQGEGRGGRRGVEGRARGLLDRRPAHASGLRAALPALRPDEGAGAGLRDSVPHGHRRAQGPLRQRPHGRLDGLLLDVLRDEAPGRRRLDRGRGRIGRTAEASRGLPRAGRARLHARACQGVGERRRGPHVAGGRPGAARAVLARRERLGVGRLEHAQGRLRQRDGPRAAASRHPRERRRDVRRGGDDDLQRAAGRPLRLERPVVRLHPGGVPQRGRREGEEGLPRRRARHPPEPEDLLVQRQLRKETGK